jgi:hypothetical protein
VKQQLAAALAAQAQAEGQLAEARRGQARGEQLLRAAELQVGY